MSEPDDASDLADLDDEQRAESEWLLARDRDPAARPPSSKIANDYAELEALLGDLPAWRADDGWHDDVLKAIASAAPPPRRSRGSRVRWTMGGALVATAAVALLALFLRSPRPELDVVIQHDQATRRGADDVAVGDRLVVTAHSRGTADLRIYRVDGILVARCPTGPACTVSSGGDYTIDVRLDAPVSLQVILVVGLPDTLPSGTLDEYMSAARAAKADVIVHPPIDVR